jgi:hypothetical protein
MMGSSSVSPPDRIENSTQGPLELSFPAGCCKVRCSAPNPEGWAYRSSLWFGDVARCGDGSRPESQSLLAALAGEIAIGITTTRGGGDAVSP